MFLKKNSVIALIMGILILVLALALSHVIHAGFRAAQAQGSIEEIWHTQLGDGAVRDLAVADEMIYVVGERSSGDAFLAVLDSKGIVQQDWPHSSIDQLVAVDAGASAGYAAGNKLKVAGEMLYNGAYIMKFELSSGKAHWIKALEKMTAARDILVVNRDRICVAGQAEKIGEGQITDTNAVVIMLDSSGNEIRHVSISTAGEDIAYGLASASEKLICVVGKSGTKGFVKIFDTEFRELFSRELEGYVLRTVAEDSGKIYAAGEKGGKAFVMKMDSTTGVIDWEQVYGDPGGTACAMDIDLTLVEIIYLFGQENPLTSFISIHSSRTGNLVSKLTADDIEYLAGARGSFYAGGRNKATGKAFVANYKFGIDDPKTEIERAKSLIVSWDLPKGSETSLLKKLDSFTAMWIRIEEETASEKAKAAAKEMLMAAINEAKALQRAGVLSEDRRDLLIIKLNAIIEDIEAQMQ